MVDLATLQSANKEMLLNKAAEKDFYNLTAQLKAYRGTLGDHKEFDGKF